MVPVQAGALCGIRRGYAPTGPRSVLQGCARRRNRYRRGAGV